MATDFSQFTVEVAKILLGQPNLKLSTSTELRWGHKGSFSVDIIRGVWHDHETKDGGGCVDLVKRFTGNDGMNAVSWMRDHGFQIGNGGGNGKTNGHAAAHDDPNWYTGASLVATYEYVDEQGDVLFRVERWEKRLPGHAKAEKRFAQYRRANPLTEPPGTWVGRVKVKKNGWVADVRGKVRQVPYRLPEIIEAIASGNPIFIVEGEKKVDMLREWGVPATCNAGGAGKWRAEWNDIFRDADIIFLPDNDPAGRGHVDKAAAILKPVAWKLRVLDLPGLGPKEGVDDWIPRGGTVEQLYELKNGAPEWAPPESPAADAPLAVEPPDPFRWVDEALIPPRDFLGNGRHHIRGFAVLDVAAGGAGKTAYNLVESVEMATGKALLGGSDRAPLRVWFWCLEDPLVELQRRLAAIRRRYELVQADLGDRLFITAADRKLCTASKLRENVLIHEPVHRALVAALLDRQIDVLVLDPFIKSHDAPENDNLAMDRVLSQWAKVAVEANCCVKLIHHIRKTNDGNVSIESARGGKSMVDAARSVRIFRTMTEAESDRAGVDNYYQYFRTSIEKANMTLPGTRAAWFRSESVALDNGDNVGVVEPWQWPNAFADITVDDTLRVQQAVHGRNLRASSTSPDWVGFTIAQTLGLNADDPHDRARIKELFRIWKDNHLFKVEQVKDANQRKARPCVVVDKWINEG